MNYEKKYKEALNRAKHALDCDTNGLVSTDKPLIFSMFPELKESVDERIRKALINVFSTHQGYEVFFGASVEDILAWLEKQGKKSNIHQDAEDDLRRQSTIRILEYARSLDAYNQYGKESINKDIAWLENQDEQKNKINSCKIVFEDVLALECAMKTIEKADNELYEQLKSLHDRLHDVYWLEKQGEQKYDWSEEDEEMRKKLLFLMEEENSVSSWEGCYEWLKSIMR